MTILYILTLFNLVGLTILAIVAYKQATLSSKIVQVLAKHKNEVAEAIAVTHVKIETLDETKANKRTKKPAGV